MASSSSNLLHRDNSMSLPNPKSISPSTRHSTGSTPGRSSRSSANKRRASSSASVSASPPPETQGKRLKQAEQEYEEDEGDLIVDEAAGDNNDDAEGSKPKVTRGSKACNVCRKMKMRCIPVENGDICKRCQAGGHSCVFEKSMRGRRSYTKRDDLAQSLRQMEATLGSVLQSIGSFNRLPTSSAELFTAPTFASLATSAAPSQLSMVPISHPIATEHTNHSDHPPSAHSISTEHTSYPDHAPFPDSISFNLPLVLPELTTSKPTSPPISSELSRTGPIYASESEAGYDPSSGLGVPGTTHQFRPDETPRLHALPADSLNPLGLIVEASRQTPKSVTITLTEVLSASDGDLDFPEHEVPAEANRRRGIANANYFNPGPLQIIPLRRIIIEQRLASVLITEKIVTFSEVEELFELYFSKCHLALAILDPVLHTPTATYTRSPFLFTTICAVASRFYTKRTDDFFQKCLRYARRSAFEVLQRGFKSPEICQGFILLLNWNQPSERYEEERAYQFSGIATRMAQDLNLHRRAPEARFSDDTPEATKTLHKRELLNRERVWLFCFITDRVISFQMGKPHSIHQEDVIIRNSKRWFLQPESLPTDGGMAMIVEVHRIVTRILYALNPDSNSTGAITQTLDYPMMVRAYLSQLDQWREDWGVICPSIPGEAKSLIRTAMRSFFYYYYRLFVLSFALQHATSSPDYAMELPTFCNAAFTAAADLIAVVRDGLGPLGFFRYCFDSCFSFVCYACCFLLKLASPTFATFIDVDSALKLVMDGAQVLEDVAVDKDHTPALYASFIRSLVAGRKSAENEDESSSYPENTASSSESQSASGNQQHTELPTHEIFVDGFNHTMDLGNLAGLKSFEAMDGLGKGDGFWDNMLLPGFGGSLQDITAGVYSSTDPWLFTPLQSRLHSRAQSRATSPKPDAYIFTP